MARVLLVGEDDTLLSVRRTLLCRRWPCDAAHPSDVSQKLSHDNFQLIVLCSSISAEEAERVVSTVRQQSASAKILAIRGSRRSFQLPEADAVVDGFKPEQTLEAAIELLGESH